MNIEQEITEILWYNLQNMVNTENVTDTVAAIHSAYKDAGYAPLNHLIAGTRGSTEFTHYMTGKAWLDRFTKEADELTHYIRSLFREGYPGVTKADEREMFVKLDVLEAAKRAAGLSDVTLQKH